MNKIEAMNMIGKNRSKWELKNMKKALENIRFY